MRLRRAKNIPERLARFKGNLLLENTSQNLEKVFGNDRPVHAELGIGKGDFLLGLARMHPEINFIGVERSDSVLLQAMEKVEEESNIRFFLTNVEDLGQVLEENSLSGLYLNFSDPWPKKGHYKRRLTYRDYLAMYDRWLKEGSLVQLKTDSASLFAFSIEEISLGHVLKDVTLEVKGHSAYEDNIQTEYEAKFSEQGKPIYALRYHSRKAEL